MSRKGLPEKDLPRVVGEYIIGSYSPTEEELEDPEGLAKHVWDGLRGSTEWFSEDEDGEPVIEVEAGCRKWQVHLNDVVRYFEQEQKWREDRPPNCPDCGSFLMTVERGLVIMEYQTHWVQDGAADLDDIVGEPDFDEYDGGGQGVFYRCPNCHSDVSRMFDADGNVVD